MFNDALSFLIGGLKTMGKSGPALAPTLQRAERVALGPD